MPSVCFPSTDAASAVSIFFKLYSSNQQTPGSKWALLVTISACDHLTISILSLCLSLNCMQSNFA